MPVPEYAERLREALERDWGRKPSYVWWYCDVDGRRSFAVVRFDDADGKKYFPFCWVRSATGEGWNARSVPEPRPSLISTGSLPGQMPQSWWSKARNACETPRRSSQITGGYLIGRCHAAAKTDWAAFAGSPRGDDLAGCRRSREDLCDDVGSISMDLGVSNIRVVDANALASRMPDGTTREPPLGWDVADAIEEGWQSEALRKAVDEAAKPWMPCSSTDPTGTNGTNGTGYGEDISSREADTNAWEHPDLSYLGTGRSAPPSFPLEVLGEFWGPWCSKHAMARNAPVDYVAGALLAVTGALIGNKRWPYAGGEWGEPPILWVGLVGAPGSGKSPAQDPVLDACAAT